METEKNNHRGRHLSYLLRHDEHTPIEPGAWVSMQYLSDHNGYSSQEILQIVANDSKGRYEVNKEKTKIRALYGHSVKVDLCLKPEQPPETLYHGTATKSVESIMKSGLDGRSRQFVHLSESAETAFETGARHGTPVILEIDARRMAEDGFQLYRISNGTWLTTTVPPEYIRK